MFVPPDCTPRDLNTLPDSKTDALVRNDDVTTLRKGRNDTRDGRERLRVHDTSCSAQERRNIGLGLQVDILGAIKSTRATGADTVVPQSLNRLLFKSLVGIKVVEVVRAEIGNGATIG